MENASKALYMAGSLLIATMVISLLVWAFGKLGGIQDEKDKIELEEDISKFNAEYEAFNKKIMYGVDVISCINKAISNNEKYVKDGKWTTGNGSGEEAFVQVEVNLNKSSGNLHESVEMYHMDEKGKEKRYLKSSDYPRRLQSLTWKTVLENIGKTVSDYPYSGISESAKLSDIINQDLTIKHSTDYKLLNDISRLKSRKSSDVWAANGLKQLTENSSETEITIINKSTAITTAGVSIFSRIPENAAPDGWTYVKWTPCFADFKKRKFYCSRIEYDSNTGLVNNIVFTEK